MRMAGWNTKRMTGGMTTIGLAAALAGCATGPSSFPVEVSRYHFDRVADRGPFAVETGTTVAPSLEDRAFQAAVQAELVRTGFTPAAPGSPAAFVVTVTVHRGSQPLPPRHAPIQIGLGGGGFSGGYHGGTSLGGGVSFPVGGSGARQGLLTQIDVRIRRGPDAIWEGHAQSLTPADSPDATTDAIAARLAHAMFVDFPGQSGRTIEVK